MAVDLLWPSEVLPKPLNGGYKIQPRPMVIRTEMEAGTPRARRRFTATMTDIPVSFSLDQEQLLFFESWLEFKHQQGVVWFGIDLLGGLGVTTHEARFKGDVETSLVGSNTLGSVFTVMGTLEIRNRPVMSESDYDILLGDTADLFGVIGDIDDFVNVTYPELP